MRGHGIAIASVLGTTLVLGCAANVGGGSGRGSEGSLATPELEVGLSGLEGDVEQNRRNRIAIFEGNALASRVFEASMNAELRVLGLSGVSYVDRPMTLSDGATGEVFGLESDAPSDPMTPSGVPASTPCAFAMATPAIDTTSLSCRFVVSNAQDRARVRSAQALVEEPLYDEFAEEAPDPDEVRGWYARALGFGIEASVPHALDALRAAGACDREPTVSESAYERGVEAGRAQAREAVRGQQAATPRTQCDVDWIVDQALGRLEAGSIADATPLCPGFEAASTDQATYLAASTREYAAGIGAGIAEAGREERARLVREWVCEIPDSPGGGGGDGGGSGDPLVLDLDGDGVHVEPLGRGAYFDFGDTGRVLSQWLGRGDGFLVFDRDGDERIASTELFGDVTVLEDGSRAADGLAALALYDAHERGGNEDGRIDAQDAVFASLAVWVDRDGDARTDPGELSPLSDHGIGAIEHAHERFLREDGAEGHAVDVWFDWVRR